MGVNLSPNMSLPVPVPGEEDGPQWAIDLNSCMAIIDNHNHSAGSGVQINPAGIDVNADFPFANNNATVLRSVRFQVQASVLAEASDLGCLFVNGVDLYYNDVSGNHVRITQSGGVAGSPGSISNLTSPASAAYVAGSQTFVWQSDANTAANMDFGSIILRNITANSHGITINPPNALAANYSMTLPSALPSVQSFMTLDNSGNVAAPWTVDGTTIQIVSNQLSVIATGVIPIATVFIFTGTATPAGWLYCNGAAVSRVTYAALYAVIGDTCGQGNGTTTFNLPTYEGYFLRGLSGGSSRDPDASSRMAMATGGNTGNNINSVQASAFASHNHTQDSHNHTQDSHNHTQDSHNHTQNSHNHTQNDHNHTAPASNGFLFSTNAPTGALSTSSYQSSEIHANADGTGATVGYVGGVSGVNHPTVGNTDNNGVTTADKTATNNAATATNQATTATNQATTATNQATTATNQATGGSESRAINAYVRFIIKY